MARFQGEVGYGESKETSPGVWEDSMIEFPYYGDVIRDQLNLEEGPGVNQDIAVGNAFSIVADKQAVDHFHKIRYVRWMGTLWSVTSVEIRSPRLILRIGGVYNGPTA